MVMCVMCAYLGACLRLCAWFRICVCASRVCLCVYVSIRIRISLRVIERAWYKCVLFTCRCVSETVCCRVGGLITYVLLERLAYVRVHVRACVRVRMILGRVWRYVLSSVFHECDSEWLVHVLYDVCASCVFVSA